MGLWENDKDTRNRNLSFVLIPDSHYPEEFEWHWRWLRRRASLPEAFANNRAPADRHRIIDPSDIELVI